MWHELTDVLDMVRATRERVRTARTLARHLERAHSRTLELIRTSKLSIIESDKLIGKAQEYCPLWPNGTQPGETSGNFLQPY